MRADRLGVVAEDGGIAVAIPAPGAEALYLCLFDEQDREVARHRLPHRLGDVHHGVIPGVAPGTRYGLRAEGRWDPARGHRFNPQRLLIDPWATALDRVPRLAPALFDTGEAPSAVDSAPFVPKALACTPPTQLTPRACPTGPQVIYELHVRGFTMRHPDIPPALRGTFAGLAHPAAIAHLTALGVTMVELMPAAAWIEERHLPPLGLTNYWGYNPIAFLAPDPRLAPGGMAEVRAAVAALQAAGIAVIQDVVFNHTGEGDHLGPTLSLKGLGNAHFHRLRPYDGRLYVDDTGCGNTLALDRPWALRLVMDALRHWTLAAGLDGFRLDLATTLGRHATGFAPEAPLLMAMRQDPVLRDRLIIAEPWDIGHHGYRLGAFGAGWGEWNDRFRDTVRRFWRGDPGMVGDLATRLAGSADVFGPHRPVADSVNYVAAHDGFTLADLVAYASKSNHANGEQNRDGTQDNHSWNHGVEGPTKDSVILARRAGDIRALLATLLTARGTPMLGMGDECGRTQRGNNNAYAQDNEISWLDWAGRDAGLAAFTARLIAARHNHPALHEPCALTGAPVDDSGIPDVEWRRPDGAEMTAREWENPATHSLVAVLYARGDRCLVALNGAGRHATLVLPIPRPGHAWEVLADSAHPDREGPVEGPLQLPARAVLLLAETPAAPARPEAPDPALLTRLARAAGIAPIWHDITGKETRVPEGTLRALLGAMGLPAETGAQARDSLARLAAPPPLPASLTLPEGAREVLLPPEAPAPLAVLLETGEEVPLAALRERALRRLPDGREVAAHLVPLPPLPVGRHRLVAGGLSCPLTIAPARCHLPPALLAGGQRFGLTAQTYGLRRAGDQGIGDFSALAELAAAGAEAGAMLIGISPPHALIPTDRERASPYNPSDRRFLDPILLDVAALPGFADAPGVRAALAEQESIFAALRQRDAVDYPAVWAAKRRVLEAAWAACPRDHAGFAAFRAEMGPALEHFSAFTAIAEHVGHSDARAWSEGLRRADGADVAGFVAANADAVGFVAFQQWLADQQLAEAGRGSAGLYRDLAVGAAPDGAEVWSGGDAFLRGFSVGAPPDPFAPEGQVWSLPPPDPRLYAVSGDAIFPALVRANMRHAAALRVDHVLGLKRLFLVPDGAPGSEGAYLAYPFDDLLGQLALESHRAGCLVVGEDLGTVPEGIGDALQSSDVLSYRVLYFEREGQAFRRPDSWPPRAAACVSTHDLATLEGWWRGEDLAERHSLGLLDEGGLAAALSGRAADRRALLEALRGAGLTAREDAEGPMDDALAAAIHGFVSATPSALALVQAEDLSGEAVAVNLPGTDRERPNWRRRIGVEVQDLPGLPRARAILDAMAQRRTP